MFSTKSPEADWSNASKQLEHNKKLREENAGLLKQIATQAQRIRDLQDALAAEKRRQ